jgi:hypothetical protein
MPPLLREGFMLRIFAFLSTALLSPLPALAQAAPPPEPVEAAPSYPRPSLAPPPGPSFGDPGQVFIGSGADLHFATSWWSDDHSGDTSWRLRPSLDVFVIKNFSIGGALSLGHSSTKAQTTVTLPSANGGAFDVSTRTATWLLQLVPRAGYNVALADWISLYARLGVVLGAESVEFNGENDFSSYLGLLLDAPLMLHVAPHFEIGFGPNVYFDLLRNHSRPQNVVGPDGKKASIGMDLLVGGWF